MKKISLSLGLLSLAIVFSYLFAADHIDAPTVGSLSTGSTMSDVTDYYAFESPENADNYVFVCNVAGLTAPGSTAGLNLSDNLLYEFNIDNTGDNIEDLVIQAMFREGTMIVRGPGTPNQTGLNSEVISTENRVEVAVSAYGANPITAENSGIKAFAGPRDDPFFMDFFRFVDIVNGAGSALGLPVADPADGMAYATSFNNPGMDAFAGTNVMSIVIEVPKSLLGSSNTINTWVESKTQL